jgi:adiponectin receptor
VDKEELVLDDGGHPDSVIKTTEISQSQVLLEQTSSGANLFLNLKHFYKLEVKGFEELPPWYQDNELIRHHYRLPTPCVKSLASSIFHLHNETLNIWTHLIGAIIFLGLTIASAVGPYKFPFKIVLTLYAFSACFCFTLSSIFHTLLCHSEKVHRQCLCMDYFGICVLISGSIVPLIYCMFYQEGMEVARTCYIVLILTASAVGGVVNLSPKFSQPLYRPMRAVVFIINAGLGIIPIAHFAILKGVTSAEFQYLMEPLLLVGAFYLVGACFYSFRFPERFWPGKFDIFFASHQFWHVFVVLGASAHYWGVRRLAQHYSGLSS